MEFGILGPLRLVDGGQELTLGGLRERAVLAYLLLHAGHVVPAERLVDQLWGDEPPKSALKSLRVRVTGIRRVVGENIVVTQASGYVARVGAEDLDLHRFERLVARSDDEAPEAAAATLREALSLWRGPPLADFAYEPFAQAAIARLEEVRLAALERRVEADLALGRHGDLVGELDALVGENPLRERMRGQLMLALYRSGRQAEALAAYAAARRTLTDDLGLEPSVALQELERAILRQDAGLSLDTTPAPARSILVAVRDAGAEPALVAIAERLATAPPKELIVVRPVASPDALGDAAAAVERRRRDLVTQGIATRATAFVSSSPGDDVVRLATDQDVDLVVVDGGPEPLRDDAIRQILAGAPPDVAVVVGSPPRVGPVLVPFVGADHDWAAIELGAWLAGATDESLLVAGPIESAEERDASRLLADASLAIQRACGVAAQPLLVEPSAASLVAAARDAGLVVVGLTDRWNVDGLGPVREALTREAPTAVVLVRGGLRPGGLAPTTRLTRFTWSIRA